MRYESSRTVSADVARTRPAMSGAGSGAVAAPGQTAAGPAAEPAYPRILLAAGMVLADTSILNVVSPVMRDQFNASIGSLQLAIAGYQIGYASVLVAAGAVGDRRGRPETFRIGLAAFALTSIACAAAPNIGCLIAFRVVQGLAAGVLFPQILGIIRGAVADRQVGLVAAMSMIMSLATVVGPIVAGVIVYSAPSSFSWRLVFLINVPFCLWAWSGTPRVASGGRSSLNGQLDVVGALGIAALVTAIALPLTLGRSLGWPLWALLLLVCAAPAAVLYAWHQRLRHDRQLPCTFPVSAFRERQLLQAAIAYFLFFAASTCFFLYFSIFLEEGAGASPLAAGLSLAPYGIGAAITAKASSRLVARTSIRTVVVSGALLCALGSLGTCLLVAHLSRGWLVAGAAPALIVTGAGLGLVVSTVLRLVLALAPPQEAGSVGGALSTGQQIGGAIGILLFGLFFPIHLSPSVDLGSLRVGIEHGLIYEASAFALVAALFTLTSQRRGAGPRQAR
ncbi:arabinose efflux permease family protein [Frankia casuarinae]|uniref:Major facilitator superfamily MFS_1 n=2 Tax=Frankia casuarinae (strain DSM 45818 / CECT 9043 / HFP020203 / CcI3) TaxID=106370 RepID=Q2JBC3_FRACC|nr:major facilitator superfamily MFS_1 [Frankia casuarinae]EYT90057.1 arabinose efflux permease family protein [Frankia casuarinae]